MEFEAPRNGDGHETRETKERRIRNCCQHIGKKAPLEGCAQVGGSPLAALFDHSFDTPSIILSRMIRRARSFLEHCSPLGCHSRAHQLVGSRERAARAQWQVAAFDTDPASPTVPTHWIKSRPMACHLTLRSLGLLLRRCSFPDSRMRTTGDAVVLYQGTTRFLWGRGGGGNNPGGVIRGSRTHQYG